MDDKKIPQNCPDCNRPLPDDMSKCITGECVMGTTEPIDLLLNDFPKCPHCGYEDENWRDCSLDFADGDRNKVGCPECNESNWIESILDRKFTTATEEDDF